MKRPLLLLVLLSLLLTHAHAGIVVVGNLARRSAIQPGESFSGVILLRNSGTQPAEAHLTQCDYLFRADGSNDYGQPGANPRSNAGWMTVSPTRVKLAPGETLPVRYQGRAPADPKLRGTFWSVIMIAPNLAPALTPEGKVDQVAVGLRTTVRFAVQIITDVGQTGARSLQIQGKRLAHSEGKRALELDVANDGERLLVTLATVELFDSQGASIGRFDARRASVFPSCSIRTKFDLTDVPCGKYTAMVLLDSGEAQVMGAQYNLDIKPENSSALIPAPLAKNEPAPAR